MISRILFIIVAFLIGFVGVAQQPNFTNINVEDGLPSSEVYYSLQDSEGFMWFATDQGVSKYDGHSFTNYDEGKGLADDIIFEIFEDVNHRIWFVGLTGRLSYYQNDGIKPYKFNHLIDKHFNYKKFYSFYVDAHDNVYLGTFKGGVLKINASGEVEKINSANDYEISACIEKIDGTLLFYGAIGDSTHVKTNIKHTMKIRIGSNAVEFPISYEYRFKCKAVEIDEDYLGIIYGKKLIVYDWRNNMLTDSIIASNYYTGLSVQDANIWVSEIGNGAQGYIFRKGKLIPNFHFLQNLSVSSVSVDKDGGHWFTTTENGVYYCSSLEIRTLDADDGLLSNSIIQITSNSDVLAIGYQTGHEYQLLRSDTLSSEINGYYPDYKISYASELVNWNGCKMSFLNSFVLDTCENIILPNAYGSGNIIRENDANVLIAHELSLVIIDKPNFLYSSTSFQDKITAIEFADESNVWVGTKKELFRFNFHQNEKDTIIKDRIVSLAKSSYYDLIIVTHYNGVLGLVNGKLNSIASLSKLGKVNCIYVDQHNNIWVGSKHGIYLCSADGEEFLKKYNYHDGLPSNEITSIVKKDEILYVGTKKGLAIINEGIESYPMLDKKPHMLSIQLDSTNYKSTEVIQVNSDSKIMRVRFTSFNYSAINQQVAYRYRIMGLVDDWISIENSHITLSTFPIRGIFEMEIQGLNKDDSWSEPAVIKFECFPPFYQARWFQFGLPCFLLILIILFFKYKILAYNKLVLREITRRILGRLSTKKYLVITSDREEIRIAEHEINYIESSKEYVFIVTDNVRQIHRSSMKEMMNKLGTLDYIQVHRSYIVRKDKIDSISTSKLRIKEKTIPIGKTYLSHLRSYKANFKRLNE